MCKTLHHTIRDVNWYHQHIFYCGTHCSTDSLHACAMSQQSHSNQHAAEHDTTHSHSHTHDPRYGSNSTHNSHTQLNLSPSPSTPPSRKLHLYLIRHGERIDEVDRKWFHERYWDPPLTQAGHTQATAAAQLLHSLQLTPAPTALYSSPLLRTVQTTAAIHSAGWNLPVRFVPGLAQCAAAMAIEGMYAREAFYPLEELRTLVPHLTEHHSFHDEYDEFITACHKLCVHTAQEIEQAAQRAAELVNTASNSGSSESTAQIPSASPSAPAVAPDSPTLQSASADAPLANLLLVTHREGIRDLTRMAGRLIQSTPYCCIVQLEFDITQRKFRVLNHFSQQHVAKPTQHT